MLTPENFKIIEKQANKLYEGLELEIIEEIAERIANVGYANTVVLNNIEIAQEMGILYQDVVNLVAKYNNASVSQIQDIFETAGAKSIKFDDKIYKKAGLDPKGLSPSMMQLLESTARKTSNNLSNLTMTTANTSQTQFYNVMNKAYLEVSTGVKSYSQSILDAIKDISNQGAYIEYPSGQHRSIEAAVRTNVLTSVNQASGKLQELRAEEMGWDLVEVSAHGGARPEHAEWQGKVYSLKGLTKGYKTLEEGCDYGNVTGLCGVNCRHTFFPYYKGSAKTYTNKELRDLKNETVTYNGKEISKYEASQMQRKMERKIRQNKKDIAGLQGILTSNVKDSKLIEETRIKLANTQTQLKQNNSILNDFVKQTEFKKDSSRLVVGNLAKEVSLDIAEPLNRLINTYPKQKTNKKIEKLVDEYDKQRKIKIDYLCAKPFRYSKTLNKVLVNPNHPDFSGYNIREAIIHEVSHMVDIENDISKDINKKIDKLEKIILNKKDELNTILESDKYVNNVYLSDLFAGITKNEVYGEYAHEITYWNDTLKRNSEIVANIEVIFLKQDKQALNLINSIPELKKFYKEVTKKYEGLI